MKRPVPVTPVEPETAPVSRRRFLGVVAALAAGGAVAVAATRPATPPRAVARPRPGVRWIGHV